MRPILKYNGGKGAALCENCRVIVESDFADFELEAIRNLKVPCFCSDCDKEKNKTFCDTFELAIDKVLTQNEEERLKADERASERFFR